MFFLLYMGPIGVAAALTGAIIRWHVGKRRFKRRTITGLEWFPSYGAAVFTKLIEMLAMILAKLMILAGVLLIFAASV